MSSTRGAGDDVVYDAVMAMKQAVDIAIKHGDIRPNTVCKGVGMSTSQLTQNRSGQWDTKVAEWLKRTQGEAAARAVSMKPTSSSGASSSNGGGSSKESKKEPAAPKASGKESAEARALHRLKEDLRELEDYIPWNAVITNWGSRRTQWARRLKDSEDVQSVGKHLLALEQALVDAAMAASWRPETRDEWAEEVAEVSSAKKMLTLLQEMEENIRWRTFKKLVEMHALLKKLLAAPGGALLKEVGANTVDEDGEPLSAKLLKGRLDAFKYLTKADLARACQRIANVCSDEASACEAIAQIIDEDEDEEEAEAEAESAADEAESAPAEQSHGTPKGGKRAGARQAAEGERSEGAELQSDLEKSGAKRARVLSKEARYEQYLKQQRLHPELAGVYAEQYMNNAQQINKHYQELRVFRDDVRADSIVGVVQIEPHTTFRDLRLMVQGELGFQCENVEELMLSRTADRSRAEHAADASERWRQMSCPIPYTQNHKLVAPHFPRPADVLVVRGGGRPLSPAIVAEINRRALPREKVLMMDVSRGHEKQPIPVYNGADADPAPNDFTYVTQCVASEGLRLLLGGPQRDPWLCPFLESGGKDLKKEEQAYTAEGLFLHPPHTIHSVYECSLASGCGLNCRNRLVQRGPKYRLEVIRCMQKDGKFAKGWGVRSPDFVPRGSFLCEYIGEYISDDEAESRGIRYDDQKMSRLMDVVGDGKDVVRMCIDATHFSNLGRFLNHSCDPNCFKQRIFCDHNSRLPRIAFFALRDIEPLEELTYDYGYADVPGKTVPCLCGAANCQKLLY